MSKLDPVHATGELHIRHQQTQRARVLLQDKFGSLGAFALDDVVAAFFEGMLIIARSMKSSSTMSAMARNDFACPIGSPNGNLFTSQCRRRVPGSVPAR